MATHNTDKLIHSINVGGVVYEIHDGAAIHTLADLAALGVNTEGAFIFKGTVATVADLPTTGNKIGFVYHVTANHSEYVWAKVDGGTSEAWEEFGEHFVIDHGHNVTVTGTNAKSAVTGSATVTGSNAKSTVTGTASIPSVPKITETAKYAKVTTGKKTFVTSYTGATSKMNLTSVVPAGSATSVIATVAPTTGTVTGVSGSTKASKAAAATALAASKVSATTVKPTKVTMGTNFSIPNVNGNTSVTASKATSTTALTASKIATENKTATNTTYEDKSNAMLYAGVENGVLNISVEVLSKITGNTSVTAKSVSTNQDVSIPQYTFADVTATNTSLGTAFSVPNVTSCSSVDASLVETSDVSIPQYTFTDVTVPKAATSASTFVTSVPTTSADVATVGTPIEVANGTLSSSGAGASVMTGLGTMKTDDALTSAELAVATSTDGIHTGDDVAITTQTLSGTISGEAAAQVWTQNTGTISGEAAAQTWTQKTGKTTGVPFSL